MQVGLRYTVFLWLPLLHTQVVDFEGGEEECLTDDEEVAMNGEVVAGEDSARAARRLGLDSDDTSETMEHELRRENTGA